MINSLLQDKDYREILAIRKYFASKLPVPKYEGWLKKEENTRIVAYLEDIDAILLAKYLHETNSFADNSLSPQN